ncbi:MAG: low molecular weight protein arginine phosphatase [bacterium]|nr:low molecular weight protein arginine phosphatase [bacterium]
MNILFVCTGNLCRSPMAERMLKKFLSREGRKDVEVRSAGTHAMTGNPSPVEAIQVANQAGIDLTPHQAQPLTDEIVDWADRIVVMSPDHADYIEVNFPHGIEKIDEMAIYRPGGRPGDTIKDPYGQSLFHYRQYYGELMEAVQGFYAKLKNGFS